MTTHQLQALPVRFVDGDLAVGRPIATPARRIASACHVRGDSGPRLEVHYDEDDNVVYVFVGGAANTWAEEQRLRRTQWPDDPHEGPEKLHATATTGTLHFTEDPGMYKWEPAEVRPSGIVPWNGVAVDLTSGIQDLVDGRKPAADPWDNYFPTTNCHPVCQEDETKPCFGLYITESGRIDGIFIEAARDELPKPANSRVRERSSGRWPDHLG